MNLITLTIRMHKVIKKTGNSNQKKNLYSERGKTEGNTRRKASLYFTVNTKGSLCLNVEGGKLAVAVAVAWRGLLCCGVACGGILYIPLPFWIKEGKKK